MWLPRNLWQWRSHTSICCWAPLTNRDKDRLDIYTYIHIYIYLLCVLPPPACHNCHLKRLPQFIWQNIRFIMRKISCMISIIYYAFDILSYVRIWQAFHSWTISELANKTTTATTTTKNKHNNNNNNHCNNNCTWPFVKAKLKLFCGNCILANFRVIDLSSHRPNMSEHVCTCHWQRNQFRILYMYIYHAKIPIYNTYFYSFKKPTKVGTNRLFGLR